VCNLEVRIDKASSCLFDADFMKQEYESTFHGTYKCGAHELKHISCTVACYLYSWSVWWFGLSDNLINCDLFSSSVVNLSE